MPDQRVSVYGTDKLYEAEFIRKVLGDNGIQAFVLNKMDSAYNFGSVEIMVKRDDVIRAKKIIQDYENQ
jgi:hypothetical protein